MYEQALAVATPDEPSRAAVPRFSDDPRVPRYLLPGEERVRDIVRELAREKRVDVPRVVSGPPQNPTALPGGRAAAQGAGPERSGTRCSTSSWTNARPLEGSRSRRALALAARAEAFALKSRWREAEEQYRQAIELIDDETIKRSWWFNLADIALRARRRKPAASRLAGRPGRRHQRRHRPHAPPTFSGQPARRPISPLDGAKAN